MAHGCIASDVATPLPLPLSLSWVGGGWIHWSGGGGATDGGADTPLSVLRARMALHATALGGEAKELDGQSISSGSSAAGAKETARSMRPAATGIPEPEPEPELNGARGEEGGVPVPRRLRRNASGGDPAFSSRARARASPSGAGGGGVLTPLARNAAVRSIGPSPTPPAPCSLYTTVDLTMQLSRPERPGFYPGLSY